MLSLIAVNPSTSFVNSKTKAFLHDASPFSPYEPSSSKRSCLDRSIEMSNHPSQSRSLNSGQTISLTANANIDQVIGGGVVLFKLLLSFKLKINGAGMDFQKYSFWCGRFSVSANDIISGRHSVNKTQHARKEEGMEDTY